MGLQEMRAEIDRIDREIVTLYLRRMETVKAIGAWKRENNVPVRDPEREKRLLDEAAAMAGEEYGDGVRALFRLLIEQSRACQSAGHNDLLTD